MWGEYFIGEEIRSPAILTAIQSQTAGQTHPMKAPLTRCFTTRCNDWVYSDKTSMYGYMIMNQQRLNPLNN